MKFKSHPKQQSYGQETIGEWMDEHTEGDNLNVIEVF